MEIMITINDVIKLKALLYDNEVAEKIYKALPLEAEGDTWGEEIYFASEVDAPLLNPTELLEAGALAYWPPMQAICIFYGPTPVSKGNEIRAAGPVSVFGKIQEGDLNALKNLHGSVNIALTKL